MTEKTQAKEAGATENPGTAVATIGDNNPPEETKVSDTVQSTEEERKGMGEATFKANVQKFVIALVSSKRLARQIAEAAAQHFFDCGDTSRLQLVLDTFANHGKNYIRIAAFKKWMKTHLAIDLIDGKLVKDKDRAKSLGEEKLAEMLASAMKEPFWDFAPDPEDVHWTADKFVTDIKAVINRYGKENYKPRDDHAIAKLAEATKLMAVL